MIKATKRTSHSGDYSAEAKLAGATQNVTTKLTPGKQYKLSGWIKTVGITAGPGAAIFLFFADQAGNSKQEWLIATIGKVKGTTEWTYYEDSFYLPEMPSNADTIQVGFAHEGGGVAWFDDLVLVGEGNPIAKFDYSPKYPSVGETVTFNASDSFDPDGRIVSWHWDFGDGSTSNEQNPTHTYSRPGSYVIRLKVSDDDQKIDWAGTEVTVIEEASFKGTALKQTAADGTSWWIVKVEKVLSGPSISGKIPVSSRAENCRGLVDENIESGDKVEVYGHYVNYFLYDAGFAESVEICSSRDYYIRKKGKAKHQVAIRVKNNDDEAHSVDIYIDRNLVKKNFSVPPGNDFRVDFYEVEEGKHTFNVKWTDEGKNYENPVEMEITSDTSITLKVKQYPKGAYLNFQISNADDDDHPHVYIYIDGDKKGFVSVPSGKTRKSKNFRVEPGRHKVTIEWEGKKEQYSRSKDVFVQLGETEVVLFQISTTALVEVTVIDDHGDRVKNAEVQIGRKEKRTNAAGFALFTIEESTYYAVVTKPGYAIPKKSITSILLHFLNEAE